MWIDRRWLIFGIAGSILVNIFLVGVVAGRVWPGRHGRQQPADGSIVPQAHVRALAPEDKLLFSAAMAAHRDQIREARKTQRAARAATESDIAAMTYDKDKVAADFAALRQANVASQEAVNNALVEALGTLSQTARADLVGHGRKDGGKVVPPDP